MLAKLPMYWQPASHTIIDLKLNTCNKLDELTNDLHLWKLTLTLTELANSIIKRVPIPLYYDIIHLSKYSISHYLWIDLVFVFKRPRALPYHKKYNLVISYPILFAIRNFNLLKIIDVNKKNESTTFIYPIFYKYGTLTKKDGTYFWSSRPRGFPSFIQTTLGIPASDWTEQWSVAALPLETTRSLGSSRNVSSVKLVVAVSIKKQICNKSVILVFIQKSWNFFTWKSKIWKNVSVLILCNNI